MPNNTFLIEFIFWLGATCYPFTVLLKIHVAIIVLLRVFQYLGKGWPFWQVFQRLNVYLNPIKFRAFLIFARFIFVLLIWAQLNNSYSCARIIFALWQNLYFRVGLSYDWKCSARQCMNYAEIRAFSDPYFPVYEQNHTLFFRVG